MTERPLVPNNRGDEAASYSEQLYATSIKKPHSPYWDYHSAAGQDSEVPFDFSDLVHDDYEPHTNNPNPASHAITGTCIDTKRSCSQLPPQILPNAGSLQHSVQNYAEVSGASFQDIERSLEPHVAHPLYNLQLAPRTGHTGSPSLMQKTPYHTSSTPRLAQASASKYEPYRAQFNSPEHARTYRKDATRFNRKPYRPPDTDNTIAEVERDRLHHVERIYNAMIRCDVARDNKGSIAMKRWVHGAYYDSNLVEAYAHKVLDCLLLQAKQGFRGWVHNDYVADDRKGEDEDRDVSCEGRLHSIVCALEEEKTICEDVMNSACQIRMFVNAPKAYANRKYQNRVGNSKRGRTKESDAFDTPPKARKLNAKSSARSRRAGSNMPTSTPQARTHSETSTSSPFLRSQPRFSTPPAQFVGSHGNYSVPVTPDDAKAIHNPIENCSSMQQPYGPTFYPGDEPLFDQPWSWPTKGQEQLCTGLDANLFARYPDAAALSPRQQASGVNAAVNFQEFWESQQGVQQFPYSRTPDYAQTRAGSRPQ
ncbi:hypothetical protein N0V90_003852 [Kalmusia sp. IMI 367209]|nr:hypothetical protein N0V90_003852 [Kalmusia sp. IMI 367209]